MAAHTQAKSVPSKIAMPQFWWSNTIFFISVHLAAVVGAYYWPPSVVSQKSLWFAFLSWQLADFGITVGYHRLYSHRAFRANFWVRLVLAGLGSAGFQGSIKWWCLRHRLHHRFTDDEEHDPYAATKGLFYSHMGWIFYKPTYERMELVDRADLESDPIVRFQHKHYVPIALTLGFVMPLVLGALWGDVIGAFVWAGLVARLAIWHCTFLVNSLAHWDGLQPYSDEDTSRGNFILAILTGGEGNHNFHAFPHDFRSGPSLFDWDPSKWIILLLHRLGLITGLRRARADDMKEAKAYMHHKHVHGIPPRESSHSEKDRWTIQHINNYKEHNPGCCLILINDYVVDATSYLGEHPGGAGLLRNYSWKADTKAKEQRDATWAFDGGLNNHSRAAKWRMQELAIAVLDH